MRQHGHRPTDSTTQWHSVPVFVVINNQFLASDVSKGFLYRCHQSHDPVFTL